jgi:hypothetical protein
MENRGSFIALLAALTLVLLSCSFFGGTVDPSPTINPIVRIENHTRPELTLDFSLFEDVGCPLNESGLRYCEEDSPLTALGCDRIQAPSDLLGGLEPGLPIAQCLVEPFRHPDQPDSTGVESEHIYRTGGGLMPVYVRYVIIQDGQFQLIKSEEQFRDVFAPVESENEALSYALALRNMSAYYDIELHPEYEYFVDQLEETNVETLSDGYLVHLYQYQFFGCGPHITYAIDLRITDQGMIEEMNRQAVYKDPSEDTLCVD